MLGSIAVALAGRAGSRLAAGLSVPASRRVLLRLVMAAPDPQAAPPPVLGLDFAFRRGQRYGTLLIDCETGAPLDLLEGRDAQPLADWLTAHPGVEVICRNRAGSFADGARIGRWTRCRSPTGSTCGRTSPRPPRSASPPTTPAWPTCAPSVADKQGPALPEPEPPRSPDPTGKYAERTQRHHALVHQLRAEGRGLREIARHPGWGLHTVQRLDRAATWQELVDGRWKDHARPSSIRSSPTWTSTPTVPRQHPALVRRDPETARVP